MQWTSYQSKALTMPSSILLFQNYAMHSSRWSNPFHLLPSPLCQYCIQNHIPPDISACSCRRKVNSGWNESWFNGEYGTPFEWVSILVTWPSQRPPHYSNPSQFTLSSISFLTVIVSSRWVVIWKALIEPYRLVVVSRPNIDLLSMYSTREGSKKSSAAPKSLQNFANFNKMDHLRCQNHQYHQQYYQHYHQHRQHQQLIRLTAHSLQYFYCRRLHQQNNYSSGGGPRKTHFHSMLWSPW